MSAWHCSTHRLGRCKRRVALATQVLLLPVDIIAHVHCTVVGQEREQWSGRVVATATHGSAKMPATRNGFTRCLNAVSKPPGAPSPAQENLHSANSPVGTSATTASATGRVRWEHQSSSQSGAKRLPTQRRQAGLFSGKNPRAHKAPPPHQNGVGENVYNAARHSPARAVPHGVASATQRTRHGPL